MTSVYADIRIANDVLPNLYHFSANMLLCLLTVESRREVFVRYKRTI